MSKILPFGAWPSPITPAMLTQSQVGLSFPSADGERIYWCEQRPQENGRTTLIRKEADGSLTELTPGEFNMRSRLHEYGGKPYLAAGDLVVVVDFATQRLCRAAPGRAPEPFTPADERRYGDLLLDPGRRRLIAVEEDHAADGKEPANRLVSLSLDDPSDRVVLFAANDFVAAPTLSPDGRRLAFLAWDHPAMPWDSARLLLVELDAAGCPGEPVCLAGGAEVAVVQPGFDRQGRLLFLADQEGFWLPYRWDGTTVAPIAVPLHDFAGPLWQLGMRWWAELDDGRLAMSFAEDGYWRLALLDPQTGAFSRVPTEASDIGDVVAAGRDVIFRAAYADRPAEIVRLRAGELTTIKSAGKAPVEPEWISHPRPILFTTQNGMQGHAFYYAPCHPEVAAKEGELPPLIVRIHGGPTSQTRAVLTSTYQFWTTRGFAILDVNYRGSSGFGRAYRNALRGQWGVADVEDCLIAAAAVADMGLADPNRLAIAGGSAGGFTTLAALTFQHRLGTGAEVFKAGASYYGVADLEALARDTHKFESRYLDQLVGPYPAAQDLYRDRSPIHHVDEMRAPTIFFQGADDKVVPPNQAEAMVAALRAKAIPTACHMFVGEGHGFRRAATIEAVVTEEYSFYMQVFGIEGGAPRLQLDLAGGVPAAR